MEPPTGQGQAGRPARQRRARSLTETLLSIVLGLESFLVFFVALAAFGLKAVPPVPAFVGGAALILLMLATARVLRYPWGVWAGWVMQVLLVLTGLVLPVMFFIAAGFVALWVYCLMKGRQIDASKGELAA